MKIKTILGILAIWALTSHANATSITLDPGFVDADPGDTISFDILYDFSSATTIGGGFDIFFDAGVLSFVDFVFAGLGDPAFFRNPDIGPGILEGIAFGDWNGISSAGLVGTLMFQVIGDAPGLTSLTMADNFFPAGPFIDLNTYQAMDVDYFGADVNISGGMMISEPGLPGLLGMGLLVLWAGRRRQHRHSSKQ